MRSYKPGDERADSTKLAILNQFKDLGDRRSVGALFELINKEMNLSPGLFFKYLGDLEHRGYIAHETISGDEWTVSVIRRL